MTRDRLYLILAALLSGGAVVVAVWLVVCVASADFRRPATVAGDGALSPTSAQPVRANGLR